MDVRDGPLAAAGKVLRAPSLKRGRNEERITDRIKLEKVLGVTVSSNAALANDPATETVAYPAGCTVVLLSTRTAQQQHIINSSRKTITSIAFSSCGRYLVTGECGHQPAVRVWDLQAETQPGPGGVQPQVPQIAEFTGHKYGVNCVAFSPSNKYVVSIGSQHDMIVNVWDWRSNIKVASNKVSTKVKAVAFAENGSYFVTVGNRHVKFWYLEHGRAKYKEAVPLMGRSAILGEQRNNYFCDVACGRARCGDSTYAITRTGLLCEFNNRRLLDKWVELRTTSANCMTVGEQYIFVGCADGIVRCFDPTTLHFVTTLPRTHYLGVDVCLGLSISHMSTHPANAKYPDAIAVTYDEVNNKLTVIYNDHSLYVWAVRDIKRVGKSHSFLYHSACIWGVEMAPRESPMPPGSFLTCSSDDTIRVWSLDKVPEQSSKVMYQKNIYSNELLKVVYVDQELTYLKDLDLSATAASSDKNDTGYDSRNGVRSIRLSPDGRHLASGDRAGNIRIHETSGMNEICKVEAHDAEVLCLEYSNLDTQHRFLASASRDRLIHVFDVNQDYNFLQTLDDHSSSITAVRFLNSHNNLQMVSCGADKSIIFRQLTESAQGEQQFSRGNNASGKATLYDMEVETSQKYVLTACQDRNIRIYNVNTGKHSKTFKGSTGDDGSLIKVVLDRSGIYVATSCTDKTLSVYDYYSGECMATMCGHSELATGLRFTNDCRRLISASGDGCIFVWKIPHDMVVTMQARLSQQAMRQGKTLDNEIFSDGTNMDMYDPNANSVDPDYRFSVSALPLWAKKQMTDETSPPVSLNRGDDNLPKGRWALRVGKPMAAKSAYADSVISFPSLQDRRMDSDGSKDSSVDSGTESRHYSEIRREMTSVAKMSTGFTVYPESYNEILEPVIQTSTSHVTMSRGEHRKGLLTDDSALGSLRDPDVESTAHDGDIEDISDQENRLQPLYYPSQQDSASGSEFPVTAMDVDELRKSQRKAKRPNLPLVSVTTTSVSGSQDSEDDDDDASTPSGENTDRNPMSMFSVSSESLDQIVTREKYLQSTFESLSGTEMETTIGKTSISSQHHRNSGGPIQLRNMDVINAAKQVKADPEATKKREELNKRIEETRRKLQSVGYRSNLKSSQSISDLSHVPEKENWFQPGRAQNQAQLKKQESDNSLRRACSLSDLSVPGSQKPKLQVSGKINKPAVTARTTIRTAKMNPITRSSSTGVLNQSDSDPENTGKTTSRNSLMRPTISSQNKVLNTKTNMNRRRIPQSVSTINLSTVGQEDSSSEETSPVPSGKPAVPPRPRSLMTDHQQPIIVPRRHAPSQKDKLKVNRHSTALEFSNKENDVNAKTVQISTQLCKEVAEQLTKAADNVVELYKRLSSPPEGNTDIFNSNVQKPNLMKILEASVVKTQSALQEVAGQNVKQNGSCSCSNNGNHDNQNDTMKKLNDLVANNTGSDQGNVINFMQQYSDILLNIMQQRMASSNKS